MYVCLKATLCKGYKVYVCMYLKAQMYVCRKKEEEAREMESIDPNIAELMGFTGFGGAKK